MTQTTTQAQTPVSITPVQPQPLSGDSTFVTVISLAILAKVIFGQSAPSSK